MRIDEILKREEPSFSVEFFPPKSEEGRAQLFETVAVLAKLDPAFFSVTYGAGGSTHDRQTTLEITRSIRDDHGVEAMAHLTCVGSGREEIVQILDRLKRAGIENVLALRGDPPNGRGPFIPPPDGFAHASDLLAFIRPRYDFCLGGAAYPEGHLESKSLEEDLAYTKRKVEAGAEFLITQMFFDNRFYFAFVARARAAGIAAPILPGIMPITNLDQIKRFTELCGAKIPAFLLERMEAVREDPEAVRQIGVDHAAAPCLDFLAVGAPGIHFYTLNRSTATRRILQSLRP